MERQYGIRVCILHTDFGEFNSEAAATYFDESGIIWESSVPNAQQQNGLVERLMRTIVEGARAQIVDSGLSLKLCRMPSSTSEQNGQNICMYKRAKGQIGGERAIKTMF